MELLAFELIRENIELQQIKLRLSSETHFTAQFLADLVTFTEEILIGKLFVCAVFKSYTRF